MWLIKVGLEFINWIVYTETLGDGRRTIDDRKHLSWASLWWAVESRSLVIYWQLSTTALRQPSLEKVVIVTCIWMNKSLLTICLYRWHLNGASKMQTFPLKNNYRLLSQYVKYKTFICLEQRLFTTHVFLQINVCNVIPKSCSVDLPNFSQWLLIHQQICLSTAVKVLLLMLLHKYDYSISLDTFVKFQVNPMTDYWYLSPYKMFT